MNTLTKAALLAAGLSMFAIGAQAQTMPGMDHGATMTPPAAGSPSEPLAQANARMQMGMEMKMTGDTDVDFARSMIPHHQGAIDMAKVELQSGKDPEMRALAEEIVKAQESEIAVLKAWLAKKGK